MQNILEKISLLNLDEFIEYLLKIIEDGEKKCIVTANPEIIVVAGDDNSVNEFLLDDDTLITADGIGVVVAYKKLTKKNIDRVTGVDIADKLILNTMKPLKLFIYGSKESVLDDFKSIVERNSPNVEFVGCYNGYDYTEEEMLRIMPTVDFDLALVALGVPKQEKFISTVKKQIDSGVIIGCGGAIDVLSDNIKRAPNWAINMNVEWLYRIVSEPKRIKAFMKFHTKFVWKTWRMKVR